VNARSPALLLALALLVCGVLFLRGSIPGLRSAVVATEAAPTQSANARLLLLESAPVVEDARTTAVPVESVADPSAAAVASSTAGAATIEVKLLWRGEPLAGADVDLFRLADEDYGFLVGEQESPLAARVRTDGEGIARFEREPSGRHGLLATAPNGSAGRELLQLGELVVPGDSK
jgi:hypothetical protein